MRTPKLSRSPSESGCHACNINTTHVYNKHTTAVVKHRASSHTTPTCAQSRRRMPAPPSDADTARYRYPVYTVCLGVNSMPIAHTRMRHIAHPYVVHTVCTLPTRPGTEVADKHNTSSQRSQANTTPRVKGKDNNSSLGPNVTPNQPSHRLPNS